jgi:hypothetical protein
MQILIDPHISLDEASHTYAHASHPGLKFTSCTQFIGSFFEPFNSQAIAEKLTLTHQKYQGQSPQELIEQWQAVAALGTKVHAEIDRYLKEKTAPSEEMSRIGVEWVEQKNWSEVELLSEVILYSTELQLAGTIDLIARDKQTGRLTLYDWKTSKQIDKSSFGDKRGIRGASQNLPDCNYVHYSLQLSLYAYMLEKHYGVTVDEIHILHLNKTSKQVEQITAQRYDAELAVMLAAQASEAV